MVKYSVGAGEVAEISFRKAELLIFAWILLTSLYLVGLGWLALSLYNNLAAWTQRRAAKRQQ
ncbi:MAG: hypothetical protein QOJ11_2605 [Frankiales bacterium]|nr:hypothetical protein [Frankiales bacterium]